MQITNFIKGRNLLTLLVISLFFLMLVNPVNAIVYEGLVDNPLGLGIFESGTLLVSEGTSPSSLSYFYTDGSGSSSTKIMNVSDYLEDACVGRDGYIYFVLTDGRVFQFNGGYGIYDFVDDYNTSFLLLGDMDALTMGRSIVADSNGNIYANSRFDIYQYSYPTYAGGVYATLTPALSTYAWVSALGLHKDGVIVGMSEGSGSGISGAGQISIVNDSGVTILYEYETAASINDYITGVFSTNNNDIYYTLDRTSYTIQRMNYSDSYNRSTISTIESTHRDIYIDADGIIYVPNGVANSISTYATVDLQGGYSYIYTAGSTGETQLEYDVSSVNSVYAAYNNDSTVEIAYNIDIDVSETSYNDPFGFGQYGGAVALLDDFYWEIDLLDPSGIKIEEISISNAVKKDYGLFDYHVIATGEKQLQSSVWENGTWTLNLYEKDRTTGLRSALDTDTFLITNEITNTAVIDVTPDIDPTLNPTDRINGLLASNAFVGILVMIACIGAFAKHGGVAGVVLGTVAGVSLAAMLGYVPMWFVFIMALALAVVFTSKLVNGLGGGE